MTVHGHRELVRILESQLPPVTLLTGPDSVGKTTIAAHLAVHHRVAPVDRWTLETRLTADAARTLVRWSLQAPFTSPVKLAIVPLDDATPTALNALLKTLEEPPATARFLLVASTRVPATIASRCQIYRFGLLEDDDVAKVLIGQGMPGSAARRLAPLGRGQVARALQADDLTKSKAVTLAVARSIAEHDQDGYGAAFAAFDENAFWLLKVWLEEAITGQLVWFTRDDFFGLTADRQRLFKMLVAVNALPAARPRLGVRAALEPFV